MAEFRKSVEILINQFSRENGSDTPDFILAEYLDDCLWAFDRAVNRRSEFYNRAKTDADPGKGNDVPLSTTD